MIISGRGSPTAYPPSKMKKHNVLAATTKAYGANKTMFETAEVVEEAAIIPCEDNQNKNKPYYHDEDNKTSCE